MGFWDKVKGFFGASTPGADSPVPAGDSVRAALEARAQRRDRIIVLSVADELTRDQPGRTASDLAAMSRKIEAALTEEWLRQNRYVRGPGFARPAETAGAPPSPAPVRAPAPPPRAAPTRAAPPSPPPARNPYETQQILSLSPEDLRKRALKIVPWRTAWIGRTDTIPPQTDERTAIIDRGLVLRGHLTEEQLAEIHRVGDLWIKHHDKASWAKGEGRVAGEAAVEELRRQKAEEKARKKAEAKAREEARQAAVAKRRSEDIVFLGRGVSGRLDDRRSNVELLEKRLLPVLSTPADVANALGIPVPRLRWLCFHAEAAEHPHYSYFEIPKRSGGKRLLSAPKGELKKAQAWVEANIVAKLTTEEPAHGFVKGRSTVSNAAPHLGQDLVVNQDLSDFFPTITFPRVRGVFRRQGYSPAVSTILALLCTEAPRRKVELAGKTYWVAAGERALPQGACTSPGLSNQIARKLDRRLAGMCAKHGWIYTRYADDLTFSAPLGKRGEVPMLLARVRHVVTDEGFRIHPDKGRVQRRGNRQIVTGIVVNEKLGLPREEVRRLRAILHGARKSGLESQNREGIPYFEAWLRGKLAYLAMVDREKGLAMLRELDQLTAREAAA